jgi:hypothetical protein
VKIIKGKGETPNLPTLKEVPTGLAFKLSPGYGYDDVLRIRVYPTTTSSVFRSVVRLDTGEVKDVGEDTPVILFPNACVYEEVKETDA